MTYPGFDPGKLPEPVQINHLMRNLKVWTNSSVKNRKRNVLHIIEIARFYYANED